ncbi:ArsO family NAD(P)H-dependent flavin-containing monooxygenase [Granulicoccus sp. GXG6511]|uniref:ArsO family NAD(P)H-dependent flavin-containing monooxygenase n=1 Tax=Granulicoccus sp. GXG6511 TaxID=3381351 RepID=UPI003D7D43B6
MDQRTGVVVIGGGQAGLAVAYFLRRAQIDYVVLDDQAAPGGAWRHTWPSLRLFSPAEFSSLPGWRMPAHSPGNPDAAHVIDYLTRYEQRYDIPVHRPVTVRGVSGGTGAFRVETDVDTWQAESVVSATGTWSRQFVPFYPGMDRFVGTQTHSAFYAGPEAYAGRRVLVVGGANSGAQIAAELSWVSDLTWCTLGPPRYLPDDVDGRELFQIASARVRGSGAPISHLGDIVVLPPVKRARDAGKLQAVRMFERFTATGIAFDDGTEQPIDDVIWCTGFRPALSHLTGLDLTRHGRQVVTDGTPQVTGAPGLYLLGYGDWCGPASATLIGVGQWARRIVQDIVERG